MRALILMVLVGSSAFGQAKKADAGIAAAPAPAEPAPVVIVVPDAGTVVEVKAVEPAPVIAEPVPAPEAAPTAEIAAPLPPPEPKGCGRWKAEGLGEGPIALGYNEADMATGRRACPRTEVGVGSRVGLIIDTANFYGQIVIDGLVYGSVAINPKTEIFGTLVAVQRNWIKTAVEQDKITLGTLTLGAMRQIYDADRLLAGVSARLMLPTSLMNPHTQLMGFEVGGTASWRPSDWLEVHGYLGGDFDFGLGAGPPLPRLGGVLTAGAQVSPFSWLALVVDATGRVGAKSYFAPTVALRFRLYSLGIELAATLPLVGTDRHDAILGGRFTLRL